MSDVVALAPAPMSAGETVNVSSEAAESSEAVEARLNDNENDSEALTPALSQSERERAEAHSRELAERGQLAQLVAGSPRLPPGLAARLSEVIASGGSLHAVVAAIEAALPAAALVADAPATTQVSQPAHPSGEAFFHGDPAAQADERAAALAREQLIRSGMLRGQRVRQV